MIIKPEYFVLKFTEGPYFTHPLLLVVSIREYEVIKILRGFRKRPGYNFLRHLQPDEKYEDNELELAYSVYLSSHIYSLSLCTKEERLEEILSYLKSRYIKSSFRILDIYEY
jgi:hypothetical protein